MFLVHIILMMLIGTVGFYACLNLSHIYLTQEKWIKSYFKHQKEENALKEAIPQHLLLLSSFLKSGQALPQALQHMAQTKTGLLLYQALSRPTENTPVHFLKICTTLSLKNGISLSPILKKLSEVSQRELEFSEKIKTLSFPLRAQATIAILLPWCVIGLFAILDPDLITQAMDGFLGVVGFSSALILEIMAIIWIKRILSPS